MQTLRLARGEWVNLPDYGAGAFKRGVTVELWIKLDALDGPARLVALPGASGDDLVFVEVAGERGDLAFGVERGGSVSRLVVPGVFAVGKWMRVACAIEADGDARVFLCGAVVAEGKLPVPGEAARPGGRIAGAIACELGQVRVWGEGVVAAEQVVRWRSPSCASSSALLSELDMAPAGARIPDRKRKIHATLVGAGIAGQSSEPELFGLDAGGAQFLQGAHIRVPALTADFSGGLTLQGWIFPLTARKGARVFDLGEGQRDNIVLARDGTSDDLRFVIRHGDRGSEVVVPGGCRRMRWTHVTVTVDPASGQCSVFLNGTIVKTAKIAAPARPAGGARTDCYIGHSNWPTDEDFQGSMAELRVWTRALAADEVAANWCRRIGGDEAGLALYYRLDRFDEQGPRDSSRARLHGSAGAGLTAGDGVGLPLRPTAESRLRVGATLQTDYLAASSVPDDRALASVDSSGAPTPAQLRERNIAAVGRREGELVVAAIHELVIEPLGEEPAPTVEVVFDADVEAVLGQADAVALQRLRAGRHEFAVPDSGVLRLRLLGDLDCAVARVRLPAMPPEEAVVASTALVLHQKLQRIDGGTLTSARKGGSPTLPAGTGPDAAETVAALIRMTSAALPVPIWTREAADEPVAFGLLGDVKGGIDRVGGYVDDVKDGADDVKDGAVDLLRKGEKKVLALPGGDAAKKLVVHTLESGKKLIEAARDVAPTVAPRQLRSLLDGAEELVVATADAGRRVVEIVGKLAGKLFKIVVRGLAAALAAVVGFLERVGGQLRDLLARLAGLFKWSRFLDLAETLHDLVLSGFDRAIAVFRDVPDPTATVDGLIGALGQSFGARKLGDLAQLGPGKLPGGRELEFIVSQFESAAGGLRLPFRMPIPTVSLADLAAPDLADLSRRLAELVRPELMTTPASVGALSLESARTLAVAGLELLRDVVAAGTRAVCDGVVATLEGLRGALTGRLKLPVFTELMETFVLGGKKLTALRLGALVASIVLTLATGPLVAGVEALLRTLLGDDGGGVAKPGKPKLPQPGDLDEFLPFGGGGGNGLGKTDKALYWAIAGFEFVNVALAYVIRAEARRARGRSSEEAIADCTGFAGLVSLAIGVMERDIATRREGIAGELALHQANLQIASGALKLFQGAPDVRLAGVAGGVAGLVELVLAGVTTLEVEKQRAQGDAEACNLTSWLLRSCQFISESLAEEKLPPGRRWWFERAFSFAVAATVDELAFNAKECV